MITAAVLALFSGYGGTVLINYTQPAPELIAELQNPEYFPYKDMQVRTQRLEVKNEGSKAALSVVIRVEYIQGENLSFYSCTASQATSDAVLSKHFVTFQVPMIPPGDFAKCTFSVPVNELKTKDVHVTHQDGVTSVTLFTTPDNRSTKQWQKIF